MKHFHSSCDRVVIDRDFVAETLRMYAEGRETAEGTPSEVIARFASRRYDGIFEATQRLADCMDLDNHQMLSVRSFVSRLTPETLDDLGSLDAALLSPACQQTIMSFGRWLWKDGVEGSRKAFFYVHLNTGKCFVATSRR